MQYEAGTKFDITEDSETANLGSDDTIDSTIKIHRDRSIITVERKEDIRMERLVTHLKLQAAFLCC